MKIAKFLKNNINSLTHDIATVVKLISGLEERAVQTLTAKDCGVHPRVNNRKSFHKPAHDFEGAPAVTFIRFGPSLGLVEYGEDTNIIIHQSHNQHIHSSDHSH